MGKKTSTPAAPDPTATAAAQTASNKETAYWNAVLNNVTQNTPYGSIKYTQDGDGTYNPDKPPQFTSTVTLSPEQQQLYDTQSRSDNATALLGEQQIGRIGQAVSTPYSYAGLGNEVSSDDVATQQKNAEDAYFARLNPQFAQDEEALRTRLINQGITQGSQAYEREMNTFNQAKNDARSQAVLAGQTYGTNAQNESLQRRNQSISEYDAQRNAPLNEYIGLTNGVQVTNPQFNSSNYTGAANTDVSGIINSSYQNQLAAANAKTASSNGLTSGLFGLGGSLLGNYAGSASGSKAITGLFSDIRLKTDIEPYDTKNGHQRYKFRYKATPDQLHIGVIAQEILETMPEAVSDKDGFLAVDYNKLGFPMETIDG